MIKSFKHKGLLAFYTTGSTKGIQAKHAKKLRMQLAALDTAQHIEDLDIPGKNVDGRLQSLGLPTVTSESRCSRSSSLPG